jgi:hypothetical protein
MRRDDRPVILRPDGRLSLRKGEAAKALGVSDESFDRYCVPHIRCVRLGSVRLYPIAELQAWLDSNSRLPLEDR